MRNRILNSARARFMATAATVFALVALGGVTATPASADVNVRVNVTVEGAQYANQTLQFQPPGWPAYTVTTDVSGGFGWGGPGWPDGDYRIFPPGNSPIYVTPALLSLSGADSQVYVDFQRYKVEGSIPADAGSGATTVQVEENNSGTWNAVGSGTVTSASGGFQFTLPDGPNQYRLRFSPAASTPYLETYSSAFTIDGSVGVYDLGALSLIQSRTISGTVLAAPGSTPLAGATVYASLAGGDVASATTNGSGVYRIVLPVTDAAYTVRAEAFGFTSQTWNVATAGADTVAVNATAGYARTGVDFTLVGLPVTISGSLIYYHLLSEVPQVSLYSGGATPTLVVAQATIVAEGLYGRYSFPAVPGGDYFVKIVPGENDDFLPTLLGDANYTEWSLNPTLDAAFSAGHSFSVSATVPSSATGHDVNLTSVGAAVLTGFLQSPGNDDPIQGCVQLTDVADPSQTLCAATAADATWEAKVPFGHSYTIHAIPSSNRYLSQWWYQTQDPASATVVSPTARGYFASYTFYIELAPATINVDAADVSATDPITVHVFYRTQGDPDWSPLTTSVTDPANAVTALSFTDLTNGEYRLRFQDSNGLWLAATTYESGVEPDGTTTAGPACFVDVFAVADGSPNFVNATFNSAAQTATCAEQQYLNGTLDGTVVTSPTFASAPVVGHEISVEDEDGTTRYRTTQADGSFYFDYVPNATYTVRVNPTVHVAGAHEYTYLATGLALGNGDDDLGQLVATRYGNVTGTITNWAAAGTTGTVTVYRLDACGCWAPGPLSVEIAADGSFEVPGVDLDGEYGVRVDFDSGYAPVFLGGGYPAPAQPFTGTAEQDYVLGNVAVDLIEYVTISGRLTFEGKPVYNGFVIAIPDGDDGTNAFFGGTDSDGYYEVEVVPNVDYEVFAIAQNSDVKIQGYGGYNYPYYYDGDVDSDLVRVGGSGVTGIDFAMVPIDEVTFDLEISRWTAATSLYTEFTDVDVHLFKKVAGVWQQIETFTSDEDAYAYTEVLGGGDYRLTFSNNGVALAVHDVYSELYYPYADSIDNDLAFTPAKCYLDLGDLDEGNYYYAEVSLVAAPVGSECGAAAPVLPPSTSGERHTNPVIALAEAGSESAGEPGAEPGDSNDGGSKPGEDDEGVVEKPTTSSAPDLAWLFGFAGILALLILAGGAIYFVRRRT